MKRRGLILILIALFCLFFSGTNRVSAAETTATLVTDASELAVGDQIIIVAKTENYALSTTQNGNNRGQAKITKDGDKVTFGVDTQIITLEKGKVEATFALNVGEKGYLCSASSGSNYLRSNTTLDENGSWSVSISSEGVATIKSQGTYTRNWIRYNSSNDIFACYASGQNDVSIYKLDATVVVTPDMEAAQFVTSYHTNFKGVYTKKSEIYLNIEATNEVSQYFRKNVGESAHPNRTTYYNGDYLLMGDFDGGFDDVNSGYMNDGNNMAHFKYSGDLKNPIANKYTSVKNTSIQDYYVTLDDMLTAGEGGFFNGWEKETDTKFTYTVSRTDNTIDETLHNILWFAAPCLDDTVITGNEKFSNYIDQQGIKLVIEQGNDKFQGKYLSFKILLDWTDRGKIIGGLELEEGSDVVLAESRVYEGNLVFDENHNPSMDIVNEAKAYIDEEMAKVAEKEISDSIILTNYKYKGTYGHYSEYVDISWQVEGSETKIDVLDYNAYAITSGTKAVTLIATISLGDASVTTSVIVTLAAKPAASQTYSYTFTAKKYSANGTQELNSVSWTLAGDGGYWGYDGTKGQQLGSGGNPYKSMTFKSSSSFAGVTKIIVNTSGASSINATLTVTVGGTQIGSQIKLTTTATDYTFTSDTPLTGEVVLTYTQTSSKAIYIKSISVTYAK